MQTRDPKNQSFYQQADGPLLGLLTMLLYTVFTLLPGSNSMMVVWPWVFIWQVALTLPVLWLFWQIWHKPLSALALGNQLDGIAALAATGILVSTFFAEFPNQARWYGWAALCGLAALYAVNGWINNPQRWRKLLVLQGGLSLGFIVLSLGLWLSQTYLPELERLQVLAQYGVAANFDFNIVSLRNWHPIGHQNYVAGYLVLELPLLVGLGIVQKGHWRWLWWTGVGLGLVALYTTSSRGGFLSLAVTGGVTLALLLLKSKLPRLWLGLIGCGFLSLLILLIGTNNRLRSLFESVLTGSEGGELAYRAITNTIGWHMGLSHFGSGIGLGGVPITYQKYRPVWAGREAELAFQLHSTPAQLWAEMGIWGFLIPLAGGVVLMGGIIRWQRLVNQTSDAAILTGALLGGLLGYATLSLTDYQLDNLCISGVLIIFLAALAYQLRQIPTVNADASSQKPLRRSLVVMGLGFFVIVQLWLIPVHRAWALSHTGFEALAQNQFDRFVQNVARASRLAPWEPYYPYQLAWNLGNLSFQTENSASQQTREAAISWFKTANAISPYQEFGYSNLGWLLVNQAPQEAAQAFMQSANLIPNKRGVFLGLGFSLLGQNQPDLAIPALVLELLRQPSLITSPIWRIDQFAAIYPQLLENLLQTYQELLNTFAAQPDISRFLHQNRGAVRWWIGDLAEAQADWSAANSQLGQTILQTPDRQSFESAVERLSYSPAQLILQAWLNPSASVRQQRLEQAWALSKRDASLAESVPPATAIAELLQSMNQSNTLRQWLTENAPSWQPRSQRLGFGALSRHIDGPIPADFLPRIENIPMTLFLSELMPSLNFMPPLDLELQKRQIALIQSIQQSE
ncbi:O-antigen ligase family protein [Almyronema epifaneia]|uniref:O-antigen ligase family protein n=1 Tax=Almyronema epifaneia S1 TaxID=2991925 RepID=A0ABW6II72_9CYAN